VNNGEEGEEPMRPGIGSAAALIDLGQLELALRDLHCSRGIAQGI
jgi:hypothetical protein